MKKLFAFILSLALLLCAVSAFSETAEMSFEELQGLEWSFSSGAGAWSTDMRILEDGSFSGEYHDSEMGETGENYPNGTVYGCSFTGRMSLAGQLDEYSWKIRVDALSMDEGQLDEAIEEGVRYVTIDPYGISESDEMILYRPGTPVEVLSENMRYWAHVIAPEQSPSELETWFLMSEKNDSGFVGYSAEESISMVNPWLDVTEEQLLEVSGLSFGIPEGAENVLFRWLESENLAEMQFTVDDDEYCARVEPAALNEGELMNISGMYFAWENEEEVTVGHCKGTIGQAQTGSEEYVELCMWYDMVPGLMYSLSVYTTDLDGLDLAAIAEQVFIPAQGND